MTQTDSPKPILDRRRLLIMIGLAALTFALLFAPINGRGTLEALTTADARYVALAIVIHYSGFAVRGWRWQQILTTLGHTLPYRHVTQLLISGWFVSALIPARAGDLMRIAMLRSPQTDEHKPVPVPTSIGSIVLERGLDILAILLLGATFGYFVLTNVQIPNWILLSYAVGIIFIIGFISIIVVLPATLKRLREFIDHPLWHKLIDFGDTLATSLRALLANPAAALTIIGSSIYIWLCDAFLLWFALRALGQILPFSSAAFIALTVDVVATIPLTPGGIGQIEGAFAALFALMNIGNTAAVILLTRAISYWTFLIFSGIITFAAGIGQFLSTGHTTADHTVDTLPALDTPQ